MSNATQQKTDAIELLKSDHAAVTELFEEFKHFIEDQTPGVDELMQELVDQACTALKVHMRIEEEIFYPAARASLFDDAQDMMNEAVVEHVGAKDLIEEIEDGRASDPMTRARFLVLAEHIGLHVREEESRMFPKLRRSSMDMEEVGRQLAARKQELEGDATRVRGIMPSKPGLWERIATLRG
ncbi:MAG TPA: hemerythrin domain-containing protein [Usitatibacter sp.]